MSRAAPQHLASKCYAPDRPRQKRDAVRKIAAALPRWTAGDLNRLATAIMTEVERRGAPVREGLA
jgi:hypothetical protein